MAYRAIFSDVDGTLITSRFIITEETQKEIEKWVDRGIPFTTVSARGGPAMVPIRRYFSFPAYQIIFSGALVEDPDGEMIYSMPLTPCEVAQVYSIMEEKFPDILCTAYTRDTWFTPNDDAEIIVFEGNTTEITPVVGRADGRDPVYKFLCMGGEEETDRAVVQLQQMLPELTIYKSNSWYIEILSGKASKSIAIDFLLKKWGMKQEESIAFGDSFNDMDMLRYAGLGVAMGNAKDEVKASADVITGTNDQDGIVQALQLYMKEE